MVTFPNAKINLGLAIVEKRPDGFHSLESCFYPVQWNDALEILPSPTLQFSSTGIKIPGSFDQNLCLKVFHSLSKTVDLPPVHIHLHKNIPIGAGMGGGSSDAAFMLKGLNTLFALALSEEEMEAIVRPLGSDCAFFIKNKPVFAYGKGDEFSPLSLSLKGYHIVVIYPEVHISTKEAYSSVVPKKAAYDMRALLEKGPQYWKNTLTNDFEASLFPKYPQLKALKESFYEQGAVYASMTGSGSAVFGLFNHKPSETVFNKEKQRRWVGIID